MTSYVLRLKVLLCFTPASWSAQLRVATYNLRSFSTEVVTQDNRLKKLRHVIELISPQVVRLREIADRAVLELLFPPSDWHLVIDDDSTDPQGLAVAVRKPFSGLGFDANLDADDQHFLGSSESNDLFPNRRDLLRVEVQVPNNEARFVLLVHRAKLRREGRARPDPRREGSARAIIRVLEQDFDDNPDDRSLNILEIGNLNAPAGPEEIDGPFLMNLTEPLAVAGHVIFGRGAVDIMGDVINSLDPASGQCNKLARDTDRHTGAILFDQILIPVCIRALLPNPDGPDEGREQVTVDNGTADEVNLAGWMLRDRAGNRFTLTGIVPAQQELTITMHEFSMPLNNSGDDVSLIDPQGQVRHHVSYSAAQAASDQVATFE